MPIPIACECGQRFNVKDSLGGNQIKCPKCGNALTVPQPATTTIEEFELDDSSSEESGSPASPMKAETGFGVPVGGSPLGGGLRGPMAGPGWPAAKPAAPKQSQGLSRGAMLAIIGGAGGLLLLIVVVVVIMTMTSGPDTAVVTPPESPSQPSTDAPGDGPPEPADSPPSSTEQPTTNEPTIPPAVPTTRDEKSKGTGSGDASVAPDSTNEAAATTKAVPTLSSAALQWHATPNGVLRGAIPVHEEDLVVQHYSWLSQLLPHVGHQELYDKIDFAQPWIQDPNLTHVRTVIPEFLNPADSRHVWSGLGYHGMGLTHFVGMSGVEDRRNVVAASLPRSDPRAGVFGYQEVARPSQITDGTSQTILVIGSGEFANPWVQGGGATVRGAREPYFSKTTGFGSKGLASEGAFAVMVDGSVRFLSAQIDPSTFRALCTIQGGDPVDLAEIGPPLAGFSLQRP